LSWEADGYINYKVINMDTWNDFDSSDDSSGSLICTVKDTTRVKIGWRNTHNPDPATVNYSVRITNESAELCSEFKDIFNVYFFTFLIVLAITTKILVALLIYFIIRGSNKKIN